MRFVTYLARLLVNFDDGDRQLWESLAKEIPFTYTREQVRLPQPQTGPPAASCDCCCPIWC